MFILLKSQSHNGEFASSEFFTHQFINSLQSQYLLNSYFEERTKFREYRDLVILAKNPHEFWKSDENRKNFEIVRERILQGELPKKVTPELEKNQNNYHRNELYFIKNYEQLEAEYHQNQQSQEYIDSIEYQIKKFEAENYTADLKKKENRQVRLNAKIESEVRELNILQGVPEDAPYEEQVIEEIPINSLKMIQSFIERQQRDPTQRDYGESKEYRENQLKIRNIGQDDIEFQQKIHSNLYDDIDKYIEIEVPDQLLQSVWSLAEWGALNQIPLAVKLAESFCSITGNAFPDRIIRLVEGLYEQTDLDEKLNEALNTANSFVGPITQDQVYPIDSNFKFKVLTPNEMESIYQFSMNFRQNLQLEKFVNQQMEINKKIQFGVPMKQIENKLLHESLTV